MSVENPKVDYTPNYLNLKVQLRKVYELMNNREYSAAAALADHMAAECRLLRTAIKSHVQH
jgi:hypothetical protein